MAYSRINSQKRDDSLAEIGSVATQRPMRRTNVRRFGPKEADVPRSASSEGKSGRDSNEIDLLTEVDKISSYNFHN